MYSIKNKIKLFYLIELFVENKIPAKVFCDRWYMIYDLEHDTLELTDNEMKKLNDLSNVIDRFSDYKEDIEEYHGVFHDGKTLLEKIKFILE